MDNITIQDFLHFPGEWSLAPYTIYTALKHCSYKECLNILEFGAGAGTEALVNFLKNKNINFSYVSVEHNREYAYVPEVDYIFYDLKSSNFDYDATEDIKSIELNLTKKFDIVIVDGPHGVCRKYWYNKFRNNIQKDSIIVIDDFHHFQDFQTELDNNFNYITINEFSAGTRFTQTSINTGIEIIDTTLPGIYNKTHKIVKII